MLLHTLPLALVIGYNSYLLNMFEGIQKVAMILAFLNLAEVLLEWGMIQCFENSGVNLERKP